MSNDLMNKIVEKIGEERLEAMLPQLEMLKAMAEKDGQIKIEAEQAAMVAGMVKPFVDGFLSEGGDQMISQVATEAYDAIADLDDDVFAMAAFVALAFDKDEIKTQVEAALSKVTYGQMIDERAKNEGTRQFFNNMSDETYTKVSEVTEKMIPNASMNFLLEVAGTKGKSLQERVKEAREKAKGKTLEDVAKDQYKTIKNLPVDEILDAVEEVVKKVSPDSVKKLRDEFTDRVKASDFVTLGQDGARIVQNMVTALANEEQLPGLDDPRVGLFIDNLTYILQSVEDAVVAADLTNDTPGLGERIHNHYAALQGPEA